MANSEKTAIKVDSLYKTFKMPHEKSNSIKGSLVNLTKHKDRTYDKLKVLSDVSFEIKKGEFFGIVGRNGSGKSTLLKLLAGIYSPDSGTVQINGRLTPFIELGVGFNPELTGRENVFLNGALLGFNRREMKTMYQDIVDFAELQKFMDMKLKNYSSGMQVRLAFSVAIRTDSDILLIDEVLAVGDQSFQEKCFEYFASIKHSDKTVVFVTHDMSNVERFCDRVFVIDKNAKINGVYSIREAVSIYNRLNHENIEQKSAKYKAKNNTDSPFYIDEVVLLDRNGNPTTMLDCDKPASVQVEIKKRSSAKNEPIVIGLAFHDKDGNNLAGPNSVGEKLTTLSNHIRYDIDKLPFNTGEYYLTVALYDGSLARQYDYIDKGIAFFVNTDTIIHGKIKLDGKWAAT